MRSALGKPLNGFHLCLTLGTVLIKYTVLSRGPLSFLSTHTNTLGFGIIFLRCDTSVGVWFLMF